MTSRRLVGAVTAVVWTVATASPVLAHGDHDAHVLARDIKAGPYVVSLWQVYPDTGDSMEPRLIVMVDDGAASAPVTDVSVEVDSSPMAVAPSTTTADGWETSQGVVKGDVIAVTISDGSNAWRLEPVVVGETATSLLPMQWLIYISSALTAVTAVWVAARTARAWRRPSRSGETTRPSAQEGVA